jgi:Zn ribbon nucleic-acid-binding protein
MFLRHEACPVCPSSDGLAVYEDGGMHCFSCGYHKHGHALARLKMTDKQSSSKPNHAVLSPDLPQQAVAYLQQYGLITAEMKLWQWDIKRSRIVWKDGDFYNGRSFTEQPKWLSFGTKPKTIRGAGAPLVFVEDIISAIKVSRHTECLCLFGSHITIDMVPLGRQPYVIWLDADKAQESAKYAKRLRVMGMQAHSLVTEKDPKEYNDNEIVNYLKGVV